MTDIERLMQDSEVMRMLKIGNPELSRNLKQQELPIGLFEIERHIREPLEQTIYNSSDPNGTIANMDTAFMLNNLGIDMPTAQRMAETNYASSVTGIDVRDKNYLEALKTTAQHSMWADMKGLNTSLYKITGNVNFLDNARSYDAKIRKNPLFNTYGELGDLVLDSVQPTLSSAKFLATTALLSWIPGGLSNKIWGPAIGSLVARGGGLAANAVNLFSTGFSQAGNVLYEVMNTKDADGNTLPWDSPVGDLMFFTLGGLMGLVELGSMEMFPWYRQIKARFTGRELAKHIERGVFPALSSFFWKGTAGTVAEGSEEGIQEILSIGYENALRAMANEKGADFDITSVRDTIRKASKATVDAARSMFLTSFLTAGIGQGVQSIKLRREASKNFTATKDSISIDTSFIRVPKNIMDEVEEDVHSGPMDPVRFVRIDDHLTPMNNEEAKKAARALKDGAGAVEGIVEEIPEMDTLDKLSLLNKAAIATEGKLLPDEDVVVYGNEEELDRAIFLLAPNLESVQEVEGGADIFIRDENGEISSLQLRIAQEGQDSVEPDLSYVDDPESPYSLASVTQEKALEWQERQIIRDAIGDLVEHTGGRISKADLEANVDAVKLIAETLDVPTDQLLQENLIFKLDKSSPKGERGYIQNISIEGRKQYTIHITERADATTLLHELGHFLRGTATKEQMAAFKQHYGQGQDGVWVEDINKVGDKYVLNGVQYDTFEEALEIVKVNEEAFANDFVTYLRTGEAPVEGLKNIFRRMKAVLTRFLDEFGGQLDPDVKQAFDNLLSGSIQSTGTAQAPAGQSVLLQRAPYRDFYEYQNQNMERTHKRLFSIDGMNLEFAERIENAGDIGRELAKLDGGSGWTDHYYIGEKVRKLGRVIDDDGSQFYLKDFLELPATDDLKQLEQEIVQTYKDQYNAYEGELGTLGALSKQLSFAVLDRDVPAMRDAWVDFVVEWNKLRDEHGFSPFPMNLYSPSLQAEVLKASLRDTEAEYDLSGLPALLQDASEYDQVVHRYRGTDAWMKAPNGEDSNLDERQWVLVRTPAFKKWFGDWEADPANASKVLDANGEPKVVYHYTSERFNAFDVSKARRSMDIPGFYFSDEKTNWKDMGENLIPAFLNLRNPINGKPSARSYGMETREALVSEGYDGAVTIDEDLEETEYLAFYPTQIKSADRNIGTFSPETSNILYQEAERKVPLESRVSGDDFLNAKDTIEIIREVGGDVDDNGYASVYHATSRENAKAIESSKLMYAYEDSSFFSTRPDGWIKGYGSSVLRFEIPVERLILDDLFVDEAHFRVRLSRSKTMDVERFDPVILYQAMRTIPYDELHEQEIPKNTRKAFKLMRIFPTQPNMLFPLFAKPEEGRQAFLMGKWFRAENQRPAIGGKQLAQRPGIHALGLPVFNQGKVRRKGESRVWVEVNIPEINPETQAEADSSPVESNGQLQGIRDRILQPDEAYDYKTNPSARDAGSWPIVGSMQPVRIIPDSEIEQILRENGLDRYVEDSLAGVDEALAERMTRDMTSYGESYSDGPAILYQPAPKVGTPQYESLARRANPVLKNPDGTLKVFFHGSDEVIADYDPEKRGFMTGANSAEMAFFFTDSKDVAQEYADLAVEARPIREEQAGLEATLESLKRQEDDLVERWGNGLIEEDEYWDLLDSLDLQIEETRISLDKIEVALATGDFVDWDTYTEPIVNKVVIATENILVVENSSSVGQAIEQAKQQGYGAVYFKGISDSPQGTEANNIAVFDQNDIYSVVDERLYQKEAVGDSEAFRKWFGNSVVVHEDGSPRLVYHGSPVAGITHFDRYGANGGERGLIYATDSLEKADDFAYEQLPGSSMFTYKPGRRGQIYPLYMKLENPLDFRVLTPKDYDNIRSAIEKYGVNPEVNLTSLEMVRPRDYTSHQVLKVIAEDLLSHLTEYGYDGLIAEMRRGGPLEYAVTSPTQVKSVENRGTWDSGNPNILYQSQRESVKSTVKDLYRHKSYSSITGEVASLPSPIFYQLHNVLDWKRSTARWMAENGYTQTEIERHIAAIEGQMKIFDFIGPNEIEMLPHGAGLNPWKVSKKGIATGGPIRGNIDPIYKISFDASAMCVKRLSAAATTNYVQKKLGRPLSNSERMALVTLYRAAGKQAPCIYCYVESPRSKSSEFLLRALEVVFGADPPKTWSKSTVDLAMKARDEANRLKVKSEDIHAGTLLDPELSYSEEFQSEMAKYPKIYQFLKKQMLAAKANLPKLYEEYDGQVLRLPQSLIEELNGFAGIRFFSSSDFQAEHVVDLIQVVDDMKLRKAKAHAYTKVPEFVEIFGGTGIKINTSIFAKEVDGEIVEDNWQGMEWEIAKRFRQQYDNVGTILVASSDRIARWALEQDWIDYIIPFHYSGLEKKFYGTLKWDDFTSTQNEKSLIPGKEAQKIRQFETGSVVGVSNAEGTRNYLTIAMERKIIPVFPAFMFKDGLDPVFGKSGKLVKNQRAAQTKRAVERWREMVDRGVIDWNQINMNYYKLRKDYARTDTPFLAVGDDINLEKAGQMIDEYLRGEAPGATVEKEIGDKLINMINEAEGTDIDIGVESLKAIQEENQNRTLYQLPANSEALEDFSKWFGNSLITDSQGSPLPVYRGNAPIFYRFDRGNDSIPEALKGRMFSTNSVGAVAEAYVKAENPLTVEPDGKSMADIIEGARVTGHDAVIFKGYAPDGDYIFVFDDAQIATSVAGDFANPPRGIGEQTEINVVSYDGLDYTIDDIGFDHSKEALDEVAAGIERDLARVSEQGGFQYTFGFPEEGELDLYDQSGTEELLDRDGRNYPSGYSPVRGWNGSEESPTVDGDWKQFRKIEFAGLSIRSPEDVAKMFSIYRNPMVEYFHIILVKKEGSGHRILEHHALSSGLPTSTISITKNWPHDVIEMIENSGADGYFLLHNHPSGRTDPSIPDINITKRYIQNVPGFLGHIILDHDKFAIISGDRSDMQVNKYDSSGFHDIPEREYLVQLPIDEDGISPKDIGEYALSHMGRRKGMIVMLGNDGKILAAIPESNLDLGVLRRKLIFESYPYAIYVTSDMKRFLSVIDYHKLESLKYGRHLLDIIMIDKEGYMTSALADGEINGSIPFWPEIYAKLDQNIGNFVFETGPKLYQLSEEAKRSLLENRKEDVRLAVENYYWVPDKVLEEYIGEAWADDEIRFRKHLNDYPWILEKAREFSDTDEFLTYLKEETELGEFEWVLEDELWYKRIHAYSRIMSPEDKDAQFVRIHTATDKALITLGKTLRGYTDVETIGDAGTRRKKNPRTRIVYRWGAFKGVSTIVKRLTEESSPEELQRARELVQKNPRAYRKALQVVEQAQDRVLEARGLLPSGEATREAYYDRLGEEMVESLEEPLLLNEMTDREAAEYLRSTTDKREKYNAREKLATHHGVQAMEWQADAELKALGAEKDRDIGKAKKELQKAKEELSQVSTDLRDQKKAVREAQSALSKELERVEKLESQLEKKKAQASKASQLRSALKDRRARVKELRDKLSDKNDEIRILEKKINAMEKKDSSRRLREKLSKMKDRIAQTLKFNPDTLDASYEEAFGVVMRLFADRDRVGRYEILPEEMRQYLEDETLHWIQMGKPIDEWSLGDLEKLYEAAKLMRLDARVMLEQKKVSRMSRLQSIATQMYRQTYGEYPEIKPGYGSIMGDIIDDLTTKRHQYEENTFNAMFNTIKSSIGKMQRIARMLDGNREGVLYDLLVRKAYERMTEELRESYRRLQEADEKMKELGITRSHLGKDGFTYTTYSGQKKTLTKGEVIGLYVYSQNPIGAQKLIHNRGNGIPFDQLADAIASLTEKEKAWGDYMIDNLGGDEVWERMRKVYYDVYNRNLGRRERYFTFIADGVEDEGNMDIINGAMRQSLRWVDKGMTKPINVHAIYPLKLNVTQTFTSQIKRQEHFIQWADWLRDLNYLLTKGAVGQIITMQYGKRYFDQVLDYVKDVGSPQVIMDDIERLGSKLVSNAAVAALSLNFLTMLKQLPSFSAITRGDIGLVELAETALRLTNPKTHKEAVEFIHRMSPYMLKRAISVEVEKYQATDFDWAISRGAQWFNEHIGMKGIQLMDHAVVNTLWLAAYDTYIRRNPNNLSGEELKKEAAFRATQLISETQPTSIATDLAGVQRKKSPWVRSALLFTNQIFQYINMVWYDIPTSWKAYKATKDPHELRKIIGTITNMAISGGLIILVSGAVFRRGDDDDEKYWKRVRNEVISMISSYTLPYIGSVVSQGISGFYGGDLIDLPSAFGRALGTDWSDWDKMSKRAWDLLDGILSIQGLPTAFSNRAIKALREGNPFELFGANYADLWEAR